MKNNIKPMIKLVSAALLAGAASMSSSASAATMLLQAPDSSVIVQAGGYEWVYAGPCAGTAPSCGPVVLHHDFAFATDAQWTSSFASIGALLTAFQYNPASGTGLCAASYFNTVYDQCDFRDAAAGYIWNSPLAPTVEQRTNPAGETFLVRALDAPEEVPEPASLALFGLGLAGAALARRKFPK
jgi:hypothetical protein